MNGFKNNKKCNILVAVILLLTIVILLWQNSSDKTLDEVSLKDNFINRKQLAMYVQDSKGSENYSEYTENNSFPIGYELNTDKSGCTDNNGSKLEMEGIISQNGNKISITTNKSIYCYLYFDFETTLADPTITSLVGTKDSNATNLTDNYTHSLEVKVSGSWTDEGITNYCLTEGEASSCDWQQVVDSAKNITNESYNLSTDSEGVYTINLYIKNNKGKINESPGSRTITYDKNNPIGGEMSSNDVTANGFKVTITGASDNNSSYEGKDIEKYCFKKSTEESFSCSSVNEKEFMASPDTSTTINGKVIDKSGRETVLTDIVVKTKRSYSGPASGLPEFDITNNLKETNTGDLKYRYVGTSNIDNYVCFGANSCSGATDEYMYRIIGITSDGKMKLLRNKGATPSAWNSSDGNVLWQNSTIYKSSLTNFYNDSSKVTNLMKAKIEYHTWNTGDVQTFTNGSTLYNYEDNTQSFKGYVGMPYASDFYFAYSEQGTTNCSESSCKSWIVSSDVKTLWGIQVGWTMTRLDSSKYTDQRALDVSWNGQLFPTPITSDGLAAVPVLYLISTTQISSGTGTIDDPFIIQL